MFNSVAIWHMRGQQRLGVKLPEWLKESSNRADEPGQAKVGRVNESESLQASLFEVIEILVETMMTGQIRSLGLHKPGRGHRRPRRIGGTHPDCISLMWNVGTPMGSANLAVSRPRGRSNSPAGEGRVEKRMPAAERRGEPITRRIGPYGSTRKSADAILVSHPKSGVKEANRGES